MPFDLMALENKDENMTLEDLKPQLDRIEAMLKQALSEKKTGLLSGAPVAAIAPDSDLDSQWGDPEVRKDSPQWIKMGGASYVGRKFSECPSDYLEALASFFDWKAGKDEAEGTPEKLKYAGYARKDAARARGHAKRNEGKTAEQLSGTIPF
jgi:hypothetical protein